MSDLTRLELRLERLERRLRHWRRLGVLLLATVAFSLTGWAPLLEGEQGNVLEEDVSRSPPDAESVDEVVARKVRITDERGRTMMELAAYDKGPAIRMMDEQGELRFALFLNQLGPGISMIDDEGVPRIGVAILDDAADLRMMDEEGQTWAMFAEKKSRRMFVLTDDRRTAHVGMMVHKGNASMTVTGQNGQGIAARAGEEGAEFIMHDSRGKEVFRKP